MPKTNGTPLFYVARSRIHGRGLFAARRIPAHTRIGEFTGRRATRDSQYVLWIEQDDGSYVGRVGDNDLRYANHAKDHNADFFGFEMWSLRDIQPGEEITVHYGEDWK